MGTHAVWPLSVHSASTSVLPGISLVSNPPDANTRVGVATTKSDNGGIGGGGGAGGSLMRS